MFLLYIQANSVNNAKGNTKGDNCGLALDFSMKELYAIEEIQSEENLFRLLVAWVQILLQLLFLCRFVHGKCTCIWYDRIIVRFTCNV